jgi:competence protein ComGC
MKPRKMFNRVERGEAAFTRMDLIVILTVVAVLSWVQLPSIANTRSKGQSAGCLNNHRQLARAWVMRASDNNDALVGNLDGGDVQNLANSNRTWVLGWLDFQGATFFQSRMGAVRIRIASC